MLFPVSGILLFLIPLVANKGQSDGSFKATFAIKGEESQAHSVMPEPANDVKVDDVQAE
jgi:hypothetical protein